MAIAQHVDTPRVAQEAPSVVSPRSVPPGRLAGGIFLLTLAVYLFTSNGHLLGQDQEYFYRTARAIALDRTFAIKAPQLADSNDPTRRGADGRTYSMYEPGISVLLVPLVLVGQGLAQPIATLIPHYRYAYADLDDLGSRVLVSYFNLPVSAASAALLALLVLRLGYPTSAALFVALTFALSTLAWPYSRIVFREPLLGLLLVLSVLLAFRATATRALLAGFVLALGILVKIPFVLVVPALLLLPDSKGRPLWRRPALAARVVLPALAALALLQIYSTVLLSLVSSPQAVASAGGYNVSSRTYGNVLVGLYGLLVSSGRGIIWYVPPIAAALWAFGLFARKRPALARAIVTLTVLWLLLHASWWVWHGGWGWGPRFLLPLLPLLLLPLAECWLRPSARRVAIGLAILGALVQLPGAAVSFMLAGTRARSLYLEQCRICTNESLWSLQSFDPRLSDLSLHTSLMLEGRFDVSWIIFAYTWLAPLTLVLSAGLALAGFALLEPWPNRGTWSFRWPAGRREVAPPVATTNGATLTLPRSSSSAAEEAPVAPELARLPFARFELALTGLVGLIALAVYWRTLAPALPVGDSGDLITAALMLGVPHPPGYPLYTMLGYLFGLLPFGLPAYRLNLMSAVLNAVAVALTALAIYRLLTSPDRESRPMGVSPWLAASGAAVGGLLLAFSATFWTYSLVAEVFPLNNFFAALLLLLLLEWERRPQARLFWSFALACGLATSNHHTIVLLAPAFLALLGSGAWKLWRHQRDSSIARLSRAVPHLLIAALLVLVGLLPYLYLPLAAKADPPYNWGDPATFERFWAHVTRAQYGSFNLGPVGAGSAPHEHVQLLAHYLYYAFTPAGYFLVAFGAWWLAERRAISGLAILLAFLVTGPAFVAYANPAVETPGWLTQLWIGILERFYMLPSVPFAIAAGIGVTQVLLWLGELPLQARLLKQVVSAAAVAMLALPVGVAATHWSIADQSDNYVSYNFNRDLLAPLEPGSIMLMKGDITNFGVPYLQYVEHYRPDVITVNIEQLTFPWYVEQLRRHRPELVVPFQVYTQGRGNSLRDLVDANLAARPIYIIGSPPNEPNFRAAYDVLRSGLSDRLMPKGTAPDPYALLRENLDRYTEFNPPTKVYPTISWESGITGEYVRLILDVGHLLYNARRLDESEALYRLLIEVSPTTPLTYKNLGVVLLERDGPSLEVAELWGTYLRMQPNDHQAPAMRQRVDAILETESLKDAP